MNFSYSFIIIIELSTIKKKEMTVFRDSGSEDKASACMVDEPVK